MQHKFVHDKNEIINNITAMYTNVANVIQQMMKWYWTIGRWSRRTIWGIKTRSKNKIDEPIANSKNDIIDKIPAQLDTDFGDQQPAVRCIWMYI